MYDALNDLITGIFVGLAICAIATLILIKLQGRSK